MPAVSVMFKRDWAVASLVFFFCFGLLCMKHFLLYTHVFDLGLYEQWAYLAGAGRWTEQGSLFEGIGRGGNLLFGDHLSLLLLPIGILYNFLPSTVLLFFIQAFSASLCYILSVRLPWNLHVTLRERATLFFLFVLSPVYFNSIMEAFTFELIAFPILYLALVCLRSGKTSLGFVLIVIALFSKDYVGIWASGIGLYLFSIKKRVSGIAVFLISASWLFLSIGVNVGNHNKVSDRLLGQFSDDSAVRGVFSSLSDFQELGNHLGEVVVYLLVVLLPLIFVFRNSTLHALLGMSPVLLVNILSSADTMRSLIYHYQLPVFFWILVAYKDAGCEMRLPFVYLRTSTLRFIFVFVSVVYFLAFSEYYQPLTTWWSKADAAFELHALRNRVLVSSTKVVSSNNESCRFFTDGSIAPHFASVEGICWLPSQFADGDLPYVLLPKSSPIERKNQSIVRLIINKIFRYGHVSDPSLDERINAFVAGRYGRFACQNLDGKKNSNFVECIPDIR